MLLLLLLLLLLFEKQDRTLYYLEMNISLPYFLIS